MKYRTLIIWLIINVIVLGVGSYYVYENQKSLEYLKLRSENMYQQAFHSLISHVKTIENNLAKSLVVDDLPYQLEIMSTIERQVYASQVELGKLPLILVPLVNTEATMQQIADFAWQLNSQSVKEKSSLSTEEWQALVNFKTCASQLLKNLQDVQSNIIKEDLRWVDIELALNKNEIADNTIIDGLHIVDADIKSFSETQASLTPNVNEPHVYYVGTTTIDQNTAIAKAKQYMDSLGLDGGDPIEIIESAGDIPEWVFIFDNGVNKYTCAVTKADGKLAWLIGDSILDGSNITIQQTPDIAEKFIDRVGIAEYTLVGQSITDNSVTLLYTPLVENIVIYPELFRINVSLDNGVITAVDMSDYLKYHHQRQLPVPEITRDQVADYLPENSAINNIQECIIFNQQGQEVLTLEVATELAGETYLVYINALSGLQENILRIEKTGD